MKRRRRTMITNLTLLLCLNTACMAVSLNELVETNELINATTALTIAPTINNYDIVTVPSTGLVKPKVSLTNLTLMNSVENYYPIMPEQDIIEIEEEGTELVDFFQPIMPEELIMPDDLDIIELDIEIPFEVNRERFLAIPDGIQKNMFKATIAVIEKRFNQLRSNDSMYIDDELTLDFVNNILCDASMYLNVVNVEVGTPKEGFYTYFTMFGDHTLNSVYSEATNSGDVQEYIRTGGDAFKIKLDNTRVAKGPLQIESWDDEVYFRTRNEGKQYRFNPDNSIYQMKNPFDLITLIDYTYATKVYNFKQIRQNYDMLLGDRPTLNDEQLRAFYTILLAFAHNSGAGVLETRFEDRALQHHLIFQPNKNNNYYKFAYDFVTGGNNLEIVKEDARDLARNLIDGKGVSLPWSYGRNFIRRNEHRLVFPDITLDATAGLNRGMTVRDALLGYGDNKQTGNRINYPLVALLAYYMYDYMIEGGV